MRITLKQTEIEKTKCSDVLKRLMSVQRAIKSLGNRLITPVRPHEYTREPVSGLRLYTCT